MGLLVEGVWQDDVSRTKDGHFIRPATQFRNWVTPDGSPGPSGEAGYAAESGRYHLYVSLACPWAHRTIIFRKLKALESSPCRLCRPTWGAKAGPSTSRRGLPATR